MTDNRAKGKRNLLILNWLRLACQLVGVVTLFASLAGVLDVSSLGAMSFLVFGMALAGWAGNLQEIVDLKYRVAKLEGPAGN